jgi:hypothetical protein
MRLHTPTLFIVGLGSMLHPLHAQTMSEADRAFIKVVGHGDKAALGKLLDPDFVWIAATGKLETKAQVLESVPPLAIPVDSAADHMAYEYGSLGDVQDNLDRLHVLRVWVKRSGDWKASVYQEVRALDAPPTVTPSAASDCQNPCKSVPYQPQNDTERLVIAAYSKLETAAMAHNSAVFATMVGDEFAAASSNSDKVSDKHGRMADFEHSKSSGIAPTPLVSARLFDFGSAVLMTSQHQPVHGKPLRVTRLWIQRNGNWVETLSYQTSISAP